MQKRRSSEHTSPGDSAVTVRFATPSDVGDLERLADFDSGWVPVGPALVAEVDGQMRAALSLRTEMVLADPFFLTDDLVRLLKVRKGQVRGRERRGHWLRGSARTARRSA